VTQWGSGGRGYDRYTDEELLGHLERMPTNDPHRESVWQELVRRYASQYKMLAPANERDQGQPIPPKVPLKPILVQVKGDPEERAALEYAKIFDEDNQAGDPQARAALAELLSRINRKIEKHDRRFGCLWWLLIAVAVIIGFNTGVAGGVIFGVVATMFVYFLRFLYSAVFPAKRFVTKKQQQIWILAKQAGMSRESLNKMIQEQYKEVAKNWLPKPS
jgi:hypothetical protein